MMKPNAILGMLCGYYLSRFDAVAYRQLGYPSQEATHVAIGKILDVPKTSIQNWRDEFDPVHETTRVGRHKREMYPSRRRVVEMLAEQSESEVHGLITAILESPEGDIAKELIRASEVSSDKADDDDLAFALRGPTGARAEELFVEWVKSGKSPFDSVTKDCRFDQCGFDYEVTHEGTTIAVEVKGLIKEHGGVSFTDKEWSTAKARGPDYFLCLVKNVSSKPTFVVVRDPATKLNANRRATTVVQLTWSIAQGPILAEALPG